MSPPPQQQLIMSTSRCRQNFHEECEEAINRQINLELHASYVYMTMAYHFARDDVALNGFHKFFLEQSDHELKHARELMTYQNLRGGRVVPQDIDAPPTTSWDSGLAAMQDALELEKRVNEGILALHSTAERHDDAQFTDFLEDNFLKEGVEHIKLIASFVANLNRVGTGLGEYMFDKETLHGEGKEDF